MLEQYVQQGLAQNQSIQQQNFLLEKSLAALQEARGLFLPTVSVGGSYTLAAGGRSISFPIGDLLNPVYATLNEMTQSNRFPQLENVNEQFLPNNFYDARLRTSVPIYNAEINYNRQIKREMVNLQQAEIQVYKRELVKEIKKAYFQYLQAAEAVKIYDNALTLLAESRRVNESLVRNGVANGTVLARTEAETAKVKSQRTEAENNRRNAAAYFNFLLGQGLETAIQADSLVTSGRAEFAANLDTALGPREELAKLATAKSIGLLSTKLSRAAWQPKLGAQLDLGSQGFNWAFNNTSRYGLLGLSFDVPLFTGGRNLAKIKQAEKDLAALSAQTTYVEQQLRLQLRTSQTAYQSALEVFNSTQGQVTASRRYLTDTEKRYRIGQANYIEYLDARNEYTNAQLQQSLARYTVWVKLAEVERAQASYGL
ncbi:MAG: TolC family protein [Bernardetiaceae bacterium]|nr:TolC family protein [Bernardetiaceae bacterium]